MTTTQYGPRNPQAMELARVALHSEMQGRTVQAAAAVQAISDETGGTGLMDAILAWCDTALASMPGVEIGKPIKIAWMEAESRRIQTRPGEVRPTAVWAGRLLAARAADDPETFHALLESVPREPKTVLGEHVFELLQSVALILRDVAEARRVVQGGTGR